MPPIPPIDRRWFVTEEFGRVASGKKARSRYNDSQAYLYDELVEQALIRAIGKAHSRETSTIKNRMGAEFDQETRTWKLSDVDIRLMKRGHKVDEGLLSVTYRALEAEVEEKTIEAPF